MRLPTLLPFRLFTCDSFVAFLSSSWWVVLFALFCLHLFEQGQKSRSTFHQELKTKRESLEEAKEKLMHEKAELIAKINSQSDPAFVELTLMKVLGVISEGQTKFYFSRERPKKEMAK